jgi:hypothetical protein
MNDFANPRQRVWFKLRPGLRRESAFDAAAGLLMRSKPEGTALWSLYIYPAGEGFSDDPEIVTFMWALAYLVDEERSWNWGGGEQGRLARVLEAELGISEEDAPDRG